MDMNLLLAELRLAELREQAARYRRIGGVRPARPSVRVMLGRGLIRLGQQVLAGVAAPGGPAPADRGVERAGLTR